MYIERGDAEAEAARQAALATQTPLGEKIFSLASHAALLAVLVVAVRRRHALTMALVSLALLVSLAYHTCQMTGACFGFSLGELQAADHLPSTLLVLLVGAFFTGLGDEVAARFAFEEAAAAEDAAEGDGLFAPALYHLNFARTALVVQLVAVALAVMYYPRDLMPVYVAIISALLAIALYHILFRVEERGLQRDGRFVVYGHLVQPVFLLVGLTMVAAGIWFFFLDHHSTLFHSFWHILASIAIIALLEAVHRPFDRIASPLDRFFVRP